MTYTVDYLDPNPFQATLTADDIQVVGEDDATALVAVSQSVPIPGGVEYTVSLSDLAGQGPATARSPPARRLTRSATRRPGRS